MNKWICNNFCINSANASAGGSIPIDTLKAYDLSVNAHSSGVDKVEFKLVNELSEGEMTNQQLENENLKLKLQVEKYKEFIQSIADLKHRNLDQYYSDDILRITIQADDLIREIF